MTVLFLTFDDSILTLCSSNITCDSFFFFTFSGSLTFFSHLTVLFSHCVILTSYVIVLLSHSVVPFFFSSHLIVLFSHYAVSTSHVTILLLHLVVLFFFLIFDGSIPTLCSSNITCDCSFVTFGGSLIFFFSYLMVPLSH